LRISKQLGVAVAAATLALGSTVALAGDAESMSKAYVDGLPDDCVFDDAYRCLENEEDNFLSPASNGRMIPGPWVNAFGVALTDFNSNDELTAEARNLRHYKIGFSQNEQSYVVLFRALLLPSVENGQVTGILRTSVGKTTKYWIDKRTMAVSKRLYLR